MLKKEASLRPMDVELHINSVYRHQVHLCTFCSVMIFLLHERKKMGANVKFCDVFFDDLHQISDLYYQQRSCARQAWLIETTLCWYIFNFWIPDFVKWWKLFICAKWWQIEIISCLQDIIVHVDVQRATREYCKSFALRKHNISNQELMLPSVVL